MKHIEFEKLVNSFENLLTAAERGEISNHLETCAECAASAGKLEGFFRYANAGASEQVSQAGTARLLNIFRPPRVVAPAESESFGKRLLASLVFDDWQTALQERFVATDSRNLLFRAENFEVDLRLVFADGKCRLSGQIFPNCEPQATAEIFSEETREKVLLNDFCEFVFPPVKEGIYSFRVKLEGKIIEIENLSLVN